MDNNEIGEQVLEAAFSAVVDGLNRDGSLHYSIDMPQPSRSRKDKEDFGKLTQWNSSNGKVFFPSGPTMDKMPPGFYNVIETEHGIAFRKITTKTEDLIRFSSSNSDSVIEEIGQFWSLEKEFKKFELPYKRGILLFGPAGAGKTSTVSLLIEDIVNRGGICFNFNCYAKLFKEGMRLFREIEPETPIVVLMEDLDATLEENEESEILNILDGAEEIYKCVFLATTNYPEKLGQRIVNRPSRFDRRAYIGYPDEKSRKEYLIHLFLKTDNPFIIEMKKDIEKWVTDTENLTFAHLKELFISVCILKRSYSDSLSVLRKMKEKVTSNSDNLNQVGFSV